MKNNPVHYLNIHTLFVLCAPCCDCAVGI